MLIINTKQIIKCREKQWHTFNINKLESINDMPVILFNNVAVKKSHSMYIYNQCQNNNLSQQIRKMQDAFSKIDVQTSQYDSANSIRKDPQSSYRLMKQRQQSHRQCIDHHQKIKMRDQCLQQIQQLKTNIRQMLQKNQRIYGKVLTASTDFTGILFTPKAFVNSLKLTTYEDAKNYQYRLLSELDKLYQQNFVLEKQLNRARFVQQNQEVQKQDVLIAKVSHYQFLRNVWQPNKRYDVPTNNSEDFIQKLNKKVAMVKLGINRMLKQQHLASNQHLLIPQIQDNFVIKSPKYQRLLKLYEQAMMKLEEQAGYINNKIKEKQRNTQIADNAVQIQNLTRKIKQLEIQMRKKDQEINAKKEELETLSKKESSLKWVFQKDDGASFEIRIYSDIKANEVQYFITPANLSSSILQQLIKQSNKLSTPPMQKQSKKSTHRRTSSHKTIESQLTLDQIQKERINLLKKTNILTQNLSQNNNNLRRNISNISKQKIDKSPDFGRQKQNMLLAAKLQATPRKQGLSTDNPNFPTALMSNQSRTKFVRSSNRQRGY